MRRSTRRLFFKKSREIRPEFSARDPRALGYARQQIIIDLPPGLPARDRLAGHIKMLCHLLLREPMLTAIGRQRVQYVRRRCAFV